MTSEAKGMTEPWLAWVTRIAEGEPATASNARDMAHALIARESERDSYIDANGQWRKEVARLTAELHDARARLVQQRDEAAAAGNDLRRERDEAQLDAKAHLDILDACVTVDGPIGDPARNAIHLLTARLATITKAARLVMDARAKFDVEAASGADGNAGTTDLIAAEEALLRAALSAHDAAADAAPIDAEPDDSPPFTPPQIATLAARGYERVNQRAAPTPVAAIVGTLGGDHTDAELLAMVDDVRGKGERDEPSGKRHCGSDECDREPYSDDACGCCCSRCGPWREWREKRDDGVTISTARKDPTT